MELILLGTSAAYPTVERASSGYLVRDGETNILVDMGSGTVRNLMRWMDPLSLDAVIISHLHQDHFIDIYPLYYYLAYHKSQKFPIDVYAPAGTREFVLQIFPPGSGSKFDSLFNFHPLADRAVFRIGSFGCRSIAVKHNMPTFGQRISQNGHVVAYSSDTAFDDALFDIADESDVFICEATKKEDYKDVLHLTAGQAGMIASKAGAKKLVLTHIWPDFDPDHQKRAAAKEYSGPIVIAEDNLQIPIGK